MKTSRGYLQGYNAQVVVDRNQIILSASVTTEQNDLQQLHPMLNDALSNLEALGYGKGELNTFLADAGYYSEDNMAPRGRVRPSRFSLLPPGRAKRLSRPSRRTRTTPRTLPWRPFPGRRPEGWPTISPRRKERRATRSGERRSSRRSARSRRTGRCGPSCGEDRRRATGSGSSSAPSTTCTSFACTSRD